MKLNIHGNRTAEIIPKTELIKRLNTGVKESRSNSVIQMNTLFDLKRRLNKAENQERRLRVAENFFKEIKKAQKYIKWAVDFDLFESIPDFQDLPKITQPRNPARTMWIQCGIGEQMKWRAELKEVDPANYEMILSVPNFELNQLNNDETFPTELIEKDQQLYLYDFNQGKSYIVNLPVLFEMLPKVVLDDSADSEETALESPFSASVSDENNNIRELSKLLNEKLNKIQRQKSGLILKKTEYNGEKYNVGTRSINNGSIEYNLEFVEAQDNKENFVRLASQKLFTNDDKYRTNPLYKLMIDIDTVLRKSCTSKIKHSLMKEQTTISNLLSQFGA